MAPHRLILRMHEAMAFANLLGTLFSEYLQFVTRFNENHRFPTFGNSRRATVAPQSNRTWRCVLHCYIAGRCQFGMIHHRPGEKAID